MPKQPVLTPEQDCEALLNAMMPLVEQALEKYRMFYPFGAGLQPDGQIVLVAGHEGGERPKTQELIDSLVQGFQEDAAKGEYKACCTLYPSLIQHTGETQKHDAITVELEHRDAFSAVVHYRYSATDRGVTIGQPSFSPGTSRIWPIARAS